MQEGLAQGWGAHHCVLDVRNNILVALAVLDVGHVQESCRGGGRSRGGGQREGQARGRLPAGGPGQAGAHAQAGPGWRLGQVVAGKRAGRTPSGGQAGGGGPPWAITSSHASLMAFTKPSAWASALLQQGMSEKACAGRWMNL